MFEHMMKILRGKTLEQVVIGLGEGVTCHPPVNVMVTMQVRAADKWLCYMCSPTHSHVGMLAKREDWDLQLRQLFINDHEMEYVKN